MYAVLQGFRGIYAILPFFIVYMFVLEQDFCNIKYHAICRDRNFNVQLLLF